MQKPPYQINSKILSLASSIQELVGELKTFSVVVPTVRLRRENKIQTVHHSLAIEGNLLSSEQITAIIENKRVIGPKNQIIEVKNAIRLYDLLGNFDPLLEKDLLKAHGILMKNLVVAPGKYRSIQVGVLKGTKVGHMAPPPLQVPKLMAKLFEFLKKEREAPWLIKACVFHYELEFIHPFNDGNGRMGRLWQQLILMKQSPLFEYISAETIIHQRQHEYYDVLEACDKLGDSTLFIEFSLENILKALQEFSSQFRPTKPKTSDRVDQAMRYFGRTVFSRKDYLLLHKGLSTATASRDLAQAVEQGLLKRTGEKSLAKYSKML